MYISLSLRKTLKTKNGSHDSLNEKKTPLEISKGLTCSFCALLNAYYINNQNVFASDIIQNGLRTCP